MSPVPVGAFISSKGWALDEKHGCANSAFRLALTRPSKESRSTRCPVRAVGTERDTMQTMKTLASVFRRVALIALLPVALVACEREPSTSDTSRRSPFQVGQPFPDLTLPALQGGRPASIRDYRGRKVILHVFASW